MRESFRVIAALALVLLISAGAARAEEEAISQDKIPKAVMEGRSGCAMRRYSVRVMKALVLSHPLPVLQKG